MEVAECSLHPGRKLPAGSQLGVGVMEKNIETVTLVLLLKFLAKGFACKKVGYLAVSMERGIGYLKSFCRSYVEKY